jgi:hypothetical protein
MYKKVPVHVWQCCEAWHEEAGKTNHTFETVSAASHPAGITDHMAKEVATSVVGADNVQQQHAPPILHPDMHSTPSISPPRGVSTTTQGVADPAGMLFPAQVSPQSLIPSIQTTTAPSSSIVMAATASTSTGGASSRPTETAEHIPKPSAAAETPSSQGARAPSTTLEGVHDLLASIREALSGVKGRNFNPDALKPQQQADAASSASCVQGMSAPPQTQIHRQDIAGILAYDDTKKAVATPDGIVRGHEVSSYLSGLGIGKPADMPSVSYAGVHHAYNNSDRIVNDDFIKPTDLRSSFSAVGSSAVANMTMPWSAQESVLPASSDVKYSSARSISDRQTEMGLCRTDMGGVNDVKYSSARSISDRQTFPIGATGTEMSQSRRDMGNDVKYCSTRSLSEAYGDRQTLQTGAETSQSRAADMGINDVKYCSARSISDRQTFQTGTDMGVPRTDIGGMNDVKYSSVRSISDRQTEMGLPRTDMGGVHDVKYSSVSERLPFSTATSEMSMSRTDMGINDIKYSSARALSESYNNPASAIGSSHIAHVGDTQPSMFSSLRASQRLETINVVSESESVFKKPQDQARSKLTDKLNDNMLMSTSLSEASLSALLKEHANAKRQGIISIGKTEGWDNSRPRVVQVCKRESLYVCIRQEFVCVCACMCI